MPKLHFASNLFCLRLTQQPRCPSHISVASAWQCGLHRLDRMFHRTHAGAYVHFSRILPNDEKTSKKWPFFGQKLSFFGLRQAVEDHFPSKIGQKRKFFGQKLNFFAFSQAVKDSPPISRVLDAKKQGVGTHRSGKHNLQHPYAPKFPNFHEKNGKKWPLFGQKLSFSASDKQLKTPRPILRVLDAKKQVLERDRSHKHNLQHTFFMKKRPRMAVFGQKLSFSASDKHLKTPPPLFRGCWMRKSRF